MLLERAIRSALAQDHSGLDETLKVELIWTRDWETIDELRNAVLIWLKEYNHERPHQSLNWLTPAERRSANLAKRLDAAA